jgi:hypothetical protein
MLPEGAGGPPVAGTAAIDAAAGGVEAPGGMAQVTLPKRDALWKLP